MAIARALASDEEEEEEEDDDDGDDEEAPGFALAAPLGAPFDRVCTMETFAVAAMCWRKGESEREREKVPKTDEEEKSVETAKSIVLLNEFPSLPLFLRPRRKLSGGQVLCHLFFSLHTATTKANR